MMNCSWASAPPSTGRPDGWAPVGPGPRRLDRRPGESSDWSSWRRNTDKAVTRSVGGRSRQASGRGGDDGKRCVGLVVVRSPVQEGGNRPTEPDGVERLDEPALGTRAAGQEHVGPPVQQHQDRHVAELAVGGLEVKLEGGGHAAHVAHLHVDDDQVGHRLGHQGHHLGPGPRLDDGGVRLQGDGRRSRPGRSERHWPRGWSARPQRLAPAVGPAPRGPGSRRRPPGSSPGVTQASSWPNNRSATYPRPSRSWTSVLRRGTR